MNNPIITLTTDFGTKDAYAASMKGVILGLNPKARIVDITHDIAPQDVRQGAFVLHSAYRYFPEGTIHMAVVDPGVGSGRKIVCAKTPSYYFIGPDNGVLAPVLNREFSFVLRELSNRKYFRKTVSPTFHGRDIMAPAAAHLSVKNVFKNFGPRLGRLGVVAWPKPKKDKNRAVGEIIHVDHYGNLVSNIESYRLSAAELKKARVRLAGRVIPVTDHYASAKRGELVAIMNSSELLEIACVEGSASSKARVSVGEPVTVTWA